MPSTIEPTPDQIVAAIEAAGLTCVAVGDWAGRCRCHTGRHVDGGPKVRAWTGEPIGLTVHITTSPRYTGQRAIDYAWNILIGGNGETPGPLSQYGIDGDGRVLLIAMGRCNHVGKIGDDGVGLDALDMIRDGQMSMKLAYDNRGRGADADGNTILEGVEILSPPGPSAIQRAAAVKLAAALCKLRGYGPGSVHGHGEIASARAYSDPGMDMGAFRRDVAAAMGGLVAGVTTPAPTQEDTMTPEQEAKLDKLLAIETETQKRVTRAAQDAAEARALAKTAVDIATETQRRLGWQAKDTSVSEQIGAAGKAPVVTIEPSTIAAAIVELAKGN